jgi:hypothetical protein
MHDTQNGLINRAPTPWIWGMDDLARVYPDPYGVGARFISPFIPQKQAIQL